MTDYRPDIDGLRAIAVLSVIVFHIDKELLPGGFVGVDIFFVISGFLITRNIVTGITDGSFSILEFYHRRVKRIAPALLLVVFTTLVFAQFWLLPEDAERTADSALWSLFSLSNFYFWLNLDTGYFAEASNELPLLHLWSLGVEEQFYLMWPLFLMLFYRFCRVRILFIALLCVALSSFVYAEHVFVDDPSFAYYMLPTRAGELLSGALVAIAVLNQAERAVSSQVIVPLGWIGAVLVVGSLVGLSEKDVFPGLYAIPPSLGTAAIIFSGHCQNDFLRRSLSIRPLVAIGLISYSAYLWHWPLLAFLHYGYNEITPITGAAALCGTLALAWMTYRFVEQPARRSRSRAVTVFFQQYIAPAGLIACLGLGAMYLDGFGLRSLSGSYPTELHKIRAQKTRSFNYSYVCQEKRLARGDLQNDDCILGPSFADDANVILWGDSNASHYVGMLASFAREAGFKFRNVAVGACPGIDGDPKPFVAANRLSDCRLSLNIVRPRLEAFDVVILSSSWSSYRGRSDRLIQAAMKTAERLARMEKLVILLGKVPTIARFDHRCLEKSLSIPFLDCPNPNNPVADEITDVNGRLRAFAAKHQNVAYFDATPYLCPKGQCAAFDKNGLRQYRDFAHITMSASWNLGQKILRHQGLPLPFALIKHKSHQMAED
ncbi:acyltransferase family protein [Pelagibius sp. Alg239-R121]|uniref:acyltransferase family protein n=1 Tax=Pelagibius sp. Alg239-R121 TaxID=2993448 RepID=UPI0024A75053|nr:acyltransferase family protein [Pelagibius sp. Alg239-R121]